MRYCPRCEDTLRETIIDRSDPSGVWHQVEQPCRCQSGTTQWGIVALLALLLGILPAVWVAFQ